MDATLGESGRSVTRLSDRVSRCLMTPRGRCYIGARLVSGHAAHSHSIIAASRSCIAQRNSSRNLACEKEKQS